MAKLTVRDLDVAGKEVLMRVDFNVPMKDGKITNDARIVAALPTIQYLLDNGAAVIACSHLGKPNATFDSYKKKQLEKGKDESEITEEKWRKSLEELSMAPVAERLAQLLGQNVILADDVAGPDAQAKAAALSALVGNHLLEQSMANGGGDAGAVIGNGYFSDRFADFKILYEFGDYFMVDACSCACESLEGLIWIRIVLSAEDSLDRLCHNSPVSFKVCSECVLVEDELAESLLQ